MKILPVITFGLALWLINPIQGFATDAQGDAPNKQNRMANIASIVKEGRDGSAKASRQASAPPNSGYMALRMIQGLGLVAGLFLIGAHFYKKYALKDLPQTTKRIKVLERTSVGGKQALVLAEVDGQKVLVGLGGDSLSLIKLDIPAVKLEEAVEEGTEDLWFAMQKSAASS